MHAASSVIGKPIKSVVNGPADMNIKILNTTFNPRGSRSRHDITIMWSGGNTIGSFWKPCHFVSLIPHTVECSTINIDDYEQFPPLGKEEFTSTPAKSFGVPSVDPDTTINYSDSSDPVLKATIASFVQSCQTEANSIESEHVMESIIDSEYTVIYEMILLQCLIYHITSTIGIIFSINQSMLFPIKTIFQIYEHCTE
jgi:hypothetical protein